MTSALKLLAKALSFQVPPRVLLFALLNKVNYLIGTGNRRFEFERLYLENPDPWNFHSNPYERQKYELTLKCALSRRRSSDSALEVGCSIGVFTRMLAGHFDKVTAVDVSKEALAAAAAHSRTERNIRFVHGELQTLDFGGQYSVIVCAEVLYYIMQRDAQIVCQQLDRHLAADGIILLVSGIPSGKSDPLYFDGWEDVLGACFQVDFKEIVDDSLRPYQIIVFSRRD